MRQDTYHGAECDEANEGVWGDKAQANNQCVAKSLQILLLQASVDDKEENRWNLGRTRERVLDRSVLREEFGGKISVGNILIVGRERVAL